MKQFKGVGGIIVSEETGKVLTVLRSSKESNPNTWTFAGGKLDGDETPVSALTRELEEELKLTKIKKYYLCIDIKVAVMILSTTHLLC